MLYMLTVILTKRQKSTKYKWEKLDKLTLKIELIIFTTIKLIKKILMQVCLKKNFKEIDVYYIGYVTF